MHGRYRAFLFSIVIVGAIAAGGWAGGHSVAQFTDSGSATGALQAAERFPHFAVAIKGTNDPVTEGDPLLVNATVSNNGSVAATQQLQLNVSDQQNPVDTTELEVPANSSETVTLTWETVEGDGGNGRSSTTYQTTLSSEDEANTTSVTVDGSGGNGNGNGKDNGNGGNGNCNGQGC